MRKSNYYLPSRQFTIVFDKIFIYKLEDNIINVEEKVSSYLKKYNFTKAEIHDYYTDELVETILKV